jgi:hypothetical protein
MKFIFCSVAACFLFLACAGGQSAETAEPRHATQAATPATNSHGDSDDMEQMRADLERLKVLLNQMRTNLAFVQTTQTPLKHQFELETAAEADGRPQIAAIGPLKSKPTDKSVRSHTSARIDGAPLRTYHPSNRRDPR